MGNCFGGFERVDMEFLRMEKETFYLRKPFPLIKYQELEARTVYIENGNMCVFLKKLAQLSDIHIHTAGVEVAVVAPNRLERLLSAQHLVALQAEQAQQFGLFGGKLKALLLAF